MGFANFILHWLISQSIFLSRSEVVDTGGQVDPMSYFKIATSPSVFFCLNIVCNHHGSGSETYWNEKIKAVGLGGKQQSGNCSCMSPS
jgi:hypothetical protein